MIIHQNKKHLQVNHGLWGNHNLEILAKYTSILEAKISELVASNNDYEERISELEDKLGINKTEEE